MFEVATSIVKGEGKWRPLPLYAEPPEPEMRARNQTSRGCASAFARCRVRNCCCLAWPRNADVRGKRNQIIHRQRISLSNWVRLGKSGRDETRDCLSVSRS